MLATELPQQEFSLDSTRLFPTFRQDLRTSAPDIFVDETSTDWGNLSWQDLGKPYLVQNYSKHRRAWEESHSAEMPVEIQWQHFNRNFHRLFASDLDDAPREQGKLLLKNVGRMNLPQAQQALAELVRLQIWNHVHRREDAVWDPRGKRALFEGLEISKPNILFLGAAEGYEAMQLLAMYPGGHAVLVDYDDFCRTDRFGRFPEAYPFLGKNPATGGWQVYRKEDLQIDFEVCDIRDLKYGKEFDIVLSVGLIEHFSDEHKGVVFEFHRRFLKPGGYAIMTTPRRQLRSKAFYLLMGELMNYGYRELMDARQLGLYAYENGFEILRCGYIKAHNGLVTKVL